MRRILVSLLLALTLILPVAAAPSWEAVTRRVTPSIGRVALTILPTEDTPMLKGDCTAFAIDDVRHFYLTAQHCQGDTMEVDGKPAGVVFVDDKLDLLVLRVPEGRHRALKSGQPVVRGTDVAAFGYAFGWTDLFVKVGVVAVPDLRIALFGHRSLTVVSFAFIEGMSGGPVVDAEGRVVSIVQASHSNGQAGQGLALPALLGATGAFWGR